MDTPSFFGDCFSELDPGLQLVVQTDNTDDPFGAFDAGGANFGGATDTAVAKAPSGDNGDGLADADDWASFTLPHELNLVSNPESSGQTPDLSSPGAGPLSVPSMDQLGDFGGSFGKGVEKMEEPGSEILQDVKSAKEVIGSVAAAQQKRKRRGQKKARLLTPPDLGNNNNSSNNNSNSNNINNTSNTSDDEVALKFEDWSETEMLSPSPSDTKKQSNQKAKRSSRKGRKRAGYDADSIDAARRRKFLERNRLAASRCRKKRKDQENNLQQKRVELEQQYHKMLAIKNSLASELSCIKSLLMSHNNCRHADVDKWIAEEATSFFGQADPAVLPYMLANASANCVQNGQNGYAGLPMGGQGGSMGPGCPQYGHTDLQQQYQQQYLQDEQLQQQRQLLQAATLQSHQFPTQDQPVAPTFSSPSPQTSAEVHSPYTQSSHSRNTSLASNMTAATSCSTSNFEDADLGTLVKDSQVAERQENALLNLPIQATPVVPPMSAVSVAQKGADKNEDESEFSSMAEDIFNGL
ncbi:bzip transcription factor [Niveomyces insectorum RCEF 264]|uniref:Bzip transcription factor n=1 Tax=Niveomyces insectorum RCEF 264 TaxID=1081102 RepID=A0A168AHL5_9HYPO|nr:bzip transcription factor [Niveomyces insectorum RCEF 264]